MDDDEQKLLLLPKGKKAEEIRVNVPGTTVCGRFDDGSVYCWWDIIQAKQVERVQDAVDLEVLNFGFCSLDEDKELICWARGKGRKDEAFYGMRLADVEKIIGGYSLCGRVLGEKRCFIWRSTKHPENMLPHFHMEKGIDLLSGELGRAPTGEILAEYSEYYWSELPHQLDLPPAKALHGRGPYCADSIQGERWCWGSGHFGRPKGASLPWEEIPQPTHLPHLETYDRITWARNQAYGWRQNRLWYWRPPLDQQLVQHPKGAAVDPMSLDHLEGTQEIATGEGFDCALMQEGTVGCWGRTQKGNWDRTILILFGDWCLCRALKNYARLVWAIPMAVLPTKRENSSVGETIAWGNWALGRILS